MRPLLLAVASLLILAGSARATQLSYIDQGQVWVSTLDGAQKRAISGPAPVVEAGESRSWTEQAQSDAGSIVAVARASGKTGAAAPTWIWNSAGQVVMQSTLGYHGPYNNGGLAVPITLDLTPDGAQMTYTYSDLVYSYPVSTLHEGTWVQNTSNPSGEPFDIPNLVGSSLVGSRWVGINAKAGSADSNIVFEAVEGQGPFSTTFTPWFHATGAHAVDMAANGSVIAVVYKLDGSSPYRLGLFAASGLGVPLPGASCDVSTVGSVGQVSIAQDGTSLAWTDDRGLLAAPMPPLGSGSPCPAASPVVISATGSHPSLGPTTLATPPAAATPSASVPGTAGPTTSPLSPTRTTPALRKPTATLAKTVRAAAFAKGVTVTVALPGAGTVTVTAKVGRVTIARAARRVKAKGTVKIKLRASKTRARQLRRYRRKTLRLVVKGPGGTATLTRKLR